MKRRGRPILGAISGFFFGLFLALDLVLFGVLALDNVIVGLLPFIGLLGGIALALAAPIGGRRVEAPPAMGAGPAGEPAPVPSAPSPMAGAAEQPLPPPPPPEA